MARLTEESCGAERGERPSLGGHGPSVPTPGGACSTIERSSRSEPAVVHIINDLTNGSY
ncbi:hypothetical protein ksw1_27140 [Staphylococcus aureus]|nr:hypothetical protein ksw1_27140 [Staphylococcus aureus]